MKFNSRSLAHYFRLSLSVLAFSGIILCQTDSVSALVAKARALEGRGRLDLAAQIWQQVLLAKPDQPEALAGLARNARQQGDAAAAQKYLERLKRVDPQGSVVSKVETANRLAQYRPRLEEAARLAANNQAQQAMVIYREVFSDDPPPGNWAIAYYETEAATPNGWEPAIHGLEKLAARYPAAEEYQLSVGRLMTYRPESRLQGMKILEGVPRTSAVAAQARDAWRQALIWDGAKPSNRPLISAYLARYPDAELQKIAEKISTTEAPAATGLVRTKEEQLAFDALNAKDLELAAKRFQEILGTSPRSVGALAGMGYVSMQHKEFAEALTYFQSAQAGMPDNADLKSAVEGASFWNQMEQGNKASAQNQVTEAVSDFRSALAMRPQSVEALSGLAGALLQNHEAAEASSLYQKLVTLNPKPADNWKLLFFAKKEATGSKSALEAVAKFPPLVQVNLGKDLEYLSVLAAAYEEAGRTEEAASVMAQTLEMAKQQNAGLPASAMLEFGGLQLQLKHPAQAAEFYKTVAKADPTSIPAWEGYIASLMQQTKVKEAGDAIDGMPKPVLSKALDRPQFLRLAAVVETRLGHLENAEALVRRVLEMEGDHPQTATETALTDIWMQQGFPAKAQRLLLQLSESNPNDADVWKMLLISISQTKKYDQATALVNRIPQAVMAKLQADPGFISALAGIRSASGETREAFEMVQGEVKLLQEDGQTVPIDMRLQYGWLLLNTKGDESELYNTLIAVGDEKALNAQQTKDYQELWSVWTRQRAADARQANDFKRAEAILDAASRLLPKDTRLTAALAATYLQSGDTARAFQMYTAWGFKGAEAGDYAGGVAAAMARKDSIATKWASAGLARFPRDPSLLDMAGKLAAGEGNYKLAEGFWHQAVAALQAQDRMNAQKPVNADPIPALKPAEVAAADQGPDALRRLLVGNTASDIGPAAAPAPRPVLSASADMLRNLLREKQASTDSPATSLASPLYAAAVPPVQMQAAPMQRSAPQMPQVISKPAPAPSPAPGMTAAYAAAPQSALNPAPLPRVQLPAPPTPVAELNPASVPVLTASAAPVPAMSNPLIPSNNYLNSTSVAFTPGNTPSPSSNGTGTTNNSSPLSDLAPASAVDTLAPGSVVKSQQQQALQDEITAVNDRNTPYAGFDTAVDTRSGRAGFEARTLNESPMEVSGVLNNSLRATLVVDPTIMTVGASTTTDLRLGLAPAGTALPGATLTGLGFEAQLSTDTLGLTVGSTPRGFLVQNMIGSLRFNPKKGPITFLFGREAIKDSRLSYAGMQDPITGQTFGGAIADYGSIRGAWGTQRSGFYVQGGYQYITGTAIENNHRIDAGGGTYRQLLSTSQGTLTTGLNLFTMEYDKNSRFFTLGQGGYFSPQEYFLASVPFTWQRIGSRIDYLIAGSLGAQYFKENAAPYFPLNSVLQSASGLTYAGQTVTGLNFNLDFRLTYKFSPNLGMKFYANANNTRNFNSETVGFGLVYTFHPTPVNPVPGVPSVPDAKGFQPLQIHQ